MRPDRTLERLADRDGWSCWICGGDTDRTVAPTAAGAPTVDHVLPRALGGTSEPANLRVAHRRCNGRRGSALPELRWPADLPVSLPAELLPAVRRRLRRPGESEVVALAAAGDAPAVASWLHDAVSSVFGGAWAVETDPDGPGPVRVRLAAVSGPPERSPARAAERPAAESRSRADRGSSGSRRRSRR